MLSFSQRPELIQATLSTLHAFLSWIPLGYIFESLLVSDFLLIFAVVAFLLWANFICNGWCEFAVGGVAEAFSYCCI